MQMSIPFTSPTRILQSQTNIMASGLYETASDPQTFLKKKSQAKVIQHESRKLLPKQKLQEKSCIPK